MNLTPREKDKLRHSEEVLALFAAVVEFCEGNFVQEDGGECPRFGQDGGE